MSKEQADRFFAKAAAEFDAAHTTMPTRTQVNAAREFEMPTTARITATERTTERTPSAAVAGHTAGPWRWTTFGQLYNGNGDAVLTAHCAHLTDDFASSADAALIAQAPDLLAERDRLKAVNAELLAALEQMVRYDDLSEAEQQPAVERARAALLRARGPQ